MKKEQFFIGLEFYTGAGKWRCANIGTGIIAAISLEKSPGWYDGPSYALMKSIMDEHDMDGCSLSPITD